GYFQFRRRPLRNGDRGSGVSGRLQALHAECRLTRESETGGAGGTRHPPRDGAYYHALSAEGSGAPFSDDAGSESGDGGLKGGNRLGNGGNQADRGPTEMASAARDHRGGAGDGRYRWLVPPASRLQAPSRDAFYSTHDISWQRIPPDFLTGWQPD